MYLEHLQMAFRILPWMHDMLTIAAYDMIVEGQLTFDGQN